MSDAVTDAETAPLPESTREAALARLDAFLPRAGKAYAAARNTDPGPENRDNVSMLSPFLRHRLIGEDEVVARVLSQHSFAASEKFVQEVFWRTYWKGWLELRPAIYTRYHEGLAQARTAQHADPRLDAAIRAATSGETGIEGFDDWARELVATGYLHNHARMWFASIWIFTLKLPWELGADFFMRHLLDGDPASNTLSWRWVAGIQTRGKTYLARRDNIERFTQGRFSPDGLSPTAEPLDDAPPPAPQGAPRGDDPPTGKVALLITEEDCRPETLALGTAEVTAIGTVQASEGRSPGMVDDKVHRFTHDALADALARAKAHYSAPGAAFAFTAASLTELAREAGSDTIVTAHAPIGPARSRLDALEPELREAGLRLVRVLRPLDKAAWPHATRGFFPFREKIPQLIGEFGLV
ncbi:FAD-binding domain-containing protein [Saliniramus fredricksonii]|uniref:Deoxyribodipyrimidine photo-lyase n=1 Tax=Saliniramus fredricksonii TaxID=1653334 RepID=A0ABY0K7R9_9HYPH|nr:FAD-binding domain-containing protein [Saliniramus fredricksonii]SCC78368.1 deoxyribodipyrimidine photo-lyase [Saliniramus fredricksonii]